MRGCIYMNRNTEFKLITPAHQALQMVGIIELGLLDVFPCIPAARIISDLKRPFPIRTLSCNLELSEIRHTVI